MAKKYHGNNILSKQRAPQSYAKNEWISRSAQALSSGEIDGRSANSGDEIADARSDSNPNSGDDSSANQSTNITSTGGTRIGSKMKSNHIQTADQLSTASSSEMPQQWSH